jgi:hypothetical protein
MTRDVVTCTRDDMADGVLAAMTAGRFRTCRWSTGPSSWA